MPFIFFGKFLYDSFCKIVCFLIFFTRFDKGLYFNEIIIFKVFMLQLTGITTISIFSFQIYIRNFLFFSANELTKRIYFPKNKVTCGIINWRPFSSVVLISKMYSWSMKKIKKFHHKQTSSKNIWLAWNQSLAIQTL